MRISPLLLALAPGMLAAQVAPDTASRRDSSRAASLERITVTAIRARDEAPISSKTIGTAEIERRSFGQDIPLLLQGTPSLTSYSEAGNHWGYSYLRMRGIDQSRINLTLDGIPLNDPEDQVLYFADFPDLANSLASIQVQRGVGTSAPGTASYGGSINLQTLPLVTTPRNAELQLQAGSFRSLRGSAEYASGLGASGLAVYGRVSALQSQGYRHHSGMEGRSAFLGAAYVGERDIVKLTALVGLFADTLAYVGATPTELAADRRHNLLRPDEVDRFGEQIAALTYTRNLRPGSSLSATAYRLSASGDYDVCIAQCDQVQGELWNFNLDFVWHGATALWSVDRERMRASIGVNGNTYARDHHAYTRADGSRLYFNTGHKRDMNGFAKIAIDAGPFTWFGDLQGRRAVFSYTPDALSLIQLGGISWRFFNPKTGITAQLSSQLDAYASYGMNSREPARSDLFAGFDNIDSSNVTFVGDLNRIRPERVGDLEAGLRYRGSSWSLDANGFVMDFRNEILPVGRLSYIGTPLRTNVPSSWRRGIETDLTWRPNARLELGINATAMQARIAKFTDDESGLEYRDVEPLLTPSFTTSHRIEIAVTPNLSLTGHGLYSSRAQLNNTGDPAYRLPPHYTANITGEWALGHVTTVLHINNVTDRRSYSSGHVSFGEARYYVLPPRSVFLIARLGT
jgi:iron complex outermembrane recepter protein